MSTLFPDEFPEERSAVIEDEYRYLLTRRWAPGPIALWIMLNPSIADGAIDDPTVKRIIGFTRREGLSGFKIVNNYALISTYPDVLVTHSDPVGPRNKEFTRAALADSDVQLVVCAWGAHPATLRTRGGIRGMVREAVASRPELRVCCFGLGKDGGPSHPLYLAADLPLLDYLAITETGGRPKHGS